MRPQKIIFSLLTACLVVGTILPTANATPISSPIGLTFDLTDAPVSATATSSDGRFIYLALTSRASDVYTDGNLIYKVDSTDFAILDSMSMPDGFDVYTAKLSPDNKYLYLGGYNSAELLKVQTSDLSILSTLAMPKSSDRPISMIISNDGSFGYFGTDDSVFKVSLAGVMSHVSSIKLPGAIDGIYGAAKNSAGTVGYFAATSWNPAVPPTIHKINLSGNMSEIRQANLNLGETYVANLVVPNDEFGYYESTIGTTVKVNEINLVTLAVTKTISLPEELIYSQFSVGSADGSAFITMASNNDKNELFKIKYSDLSIQSRTVLPDSHIYPWGMDINPLTGAVYVHFGRSGDDETPFAPGINTAAVFAPIKTKPTAPRSMKSTYSIKKAIFTWSAPLSSGGTTISKYQYCFSACTKATSWKNVVARKITKTGMKKGASGYLQIRAVNSVGISPVLKYKYKQTK